MKIKVKNHKQGWFTIKVLFDDRDYRLTFFYRRKLALRIESNYRTDCQILRHKCNYRIYQF